MNESRKETTSTLADMLKTSSHDNTLFMVPTELNENGVEIAIFDEEIVELGSAKWDKTVCGQFLGCMVSFNEARYHIRRMWNKFGLEDMPVNDKGIFFFKFQDEQGILQVISNGPWMVNNKPLFVQRWSIDVCLDKTEPKKTACLG